MDFFKPFKQAQKRKNAAPDNISPTKQPARLRKITYIKAPNESSSTVPQDFPPLFNEIFTIATASTNDGDIRYLDVSAIVLIPYIEGVRIPKEVSADPKYSTLECKITEPNGDVYRVWIISATDDSDVLPTLETVLSSVRPRIQPYAATVNFCLHIAEIEPAIKKLRDKLTPVFDPRKLHIPPKHVLDVIKFHLPCISQEQQQEIIRTIQVMPVNAGSADFQFTVAAHSISSILSTPDENIIVLRDEIYRQGWTNLLDLVKKVKSPTV